MEITVTLYGLLREKLPRASKGITKLEIQEGSTLNDVIAMLNLTGQLVVALNGQVTQDRAYSLHAGDQIQIFQPAGGGS